MFHMFGWEVKMRKVQAIVLVAGLLFSLAAGAEDKQALEKSSHYRAIWKFSWRSARCRPTSETMQPYMF